MEKERLTLALWVLAANDEEPNLDTAEKHGDWWLYSESGLKVVTNG